MDLIGIIKTLVWSIFPPESGVERFMRTQYHHLTASQPYISWKIRQSENSYSGWLERQRKSAAAGNSFGSTPLVSFFLSSTSTNNDAIFQTVRSVQAQRNPNWELLLAIESSQIALPDMLQKEIGDDARIKTILYGNNPLSTLIQNSMGVFFVCCAPGDTFENNFLDTFHEYSEHGPDPVIIYADNDEFDTENSQTRPLFKPERYSPELHLSKNYLSRSLIKRGPAAQNIGEIDPALDLMTQEWDLLFKLKEQGAVDQHIPLVLTHQVKTRNQETEQECRVIEQHLRRLGISSPIEVTRQPETRVRWNFGEPSVSIIVPTKNNRAVLKNLLESLFSLTSYKNFEVVLVDNGSTEEGLKTYYSEICSQHPVRVIEYNEPFNYSRANNLGASAARSDLLLFMNNDMQIIDPEWLTELCQWAMVPQIGIVGAKLLHQDNSIQHAGVILGLQGFVGHLYLNTPEHFFGLTGSVDWYRDYYAVTGACQMMRKDVYDELNGYDEDFKLVFSDIDLCLRAIEKNFRVLYTPHAVLKHLEGKSRGYSSPNSDILRGYDLFMDWIKKDDPYFSPNLTYTTLPMCNGGQSEITRRLQQIEKRRESIKKAM